jgi:hypothetical protein
MEIHEQKSKDNVAYRELRRDIGENRQWIGDWKVKVIKATLWHSAVDMTNITYNTRQRLQTHRLRCSAPFLAKKWVTVLAL